MNLRAEGVVALVLPSNLQGVLLLDLVIYMFAFWPIVIVLVIALWNPAPRLSHLVGLALPETLRRRINRFLRARRLFFGLALLVVSQLLLALLFAPRGVRAGHVAELALLPACMWLPCVLASLWPRWRSKGSVRLAHLRRLGVRDALTNREWAVVAAAYTVSAALIAWALARAGLAAWAVLAIAALAGQALLTYGISRRVMTAPASGSDDLELAWDDVFRLQQVRSLVASASFVTLYLLIAASGDLAGTAVFRSIVVAPALAAAMSAGAFAWFRSAAHKNWRRAWPAARR